MIPKKASLLNSIAIVVLGLTPSRSALTAESRAPFDSNYLRQDFEMLQKVETSGCPREFAEVWQRDRERTYKVATALTEAATDFRAQKEALLKETTWWGAPAYSDEAKAVADKLHALKISADLFLAISEYVNPTGVGTAYKYVTGPKNAVEFTNHLKEGENFRAAYMAAEVGDVVPGYAKPFGALITGLLDWSKTDKEFDEYRNELKASLDRLDREIAKSQAALSAAQVRFREKTEIGLKEFCQRPDALNAANDKVMLDSQRDVDVCLPVRNNDVNPGVSLDRVRVTRVGLTVTPAGTATVSKGGTCIRYQRPDWWTGTPPVSDRFDYEIQDDFGRRATAVVSILVTVCSRHAPWDPGSTDIDLCNGLLKSNSSEKRATSNQNSYTSNLNEVSSKGCPKGLVRADDACYELLDALRVAASKCDPDSGWGRCSLEERRLVAEFDSRLVCAEGMKKVAGRFQGDSYICVDKYGLRQFADLPDNPKGVEMETTPVATAGVMSTNRTTANSSGFVGGSVSRSSNEAPATKVSAAASSSSGAGAPQLAAQGVSGDPGASVGTPSGSNARSTGQVAGSVIKGGAATSFAPTTGAGDNGSLADGATDATGRECSFFTRPSIEHDASLGVSAVRMNYYADGAEVCNGVTRYRCEKRRWVKYGDCSATDPRQARRIEDTSNPNRDTNAAAVSAGSGTSGARNELLPDSPNDAPASPFGSEPSPFGGGSSPYGGEGSAFANALSASAGRASYAGGPTSDGSSSIDTRRTVPMGASGFPSGRGEEAMYTAECARAQRIATDEFQRACSPGQSSNSICGSLNELIRCAELSIRMTERMPCPADWKDETIRGMRSVINQAQSNKRKTCVNVSETRKSNGGGGSSNGSNWPSAQPEEPKPSIIIHSCAKCDSSISGQGNADCHC